ncbi:MAG TPA: histidine phosphatase family protein [Thermotogota bacterium]|nr:histidine phosphatase family protein [Thermotogota bacterium]
MDILLIRHGQSTADLEDRHEGRADFELTELGRKQGLALGKWIKNNYRIDEILSSTLKRAAATAEYISGVTAVKVDYRDELMEWDNGLLAGLYREEAERLFPLPPEGRLPHDEYAGTESMINFRARAEIFLSRFMNGHNRDSTEKKICIISHGGMINMIMRSFLRLPVDSNTSFITGDTGVHLLRIKDDKRVVVYLNRQDHLI